MRLRLCSPLLFIGAHSQCFSRPVNSHTFLTSNCLKDPSVSVPLADPGELRLMIQHDRPTSSYSPSSNFYTVLCTQLTYLLTPWCRDLLEKLTGLQLVKKFSAFYGTRRFIAAFTSFRHLSLSWASPIQSTCPQPTSWRSILKSTHLRLGLPSDLFPSGFPTRTLYAPLSSPIRATCPAHLIPLYRNSTENCVFDAYKLIEVCVSEKKPAAKKEAAINILTGGF